MSMNIDGRPLRDCTAGVLQAALQSLRAGMGDVEWAQARAIEAELERRDGAASTPPVGEDDPSWLGDLLAFAAQERDEALTAKNREKYVEFCAWVAALWRVKPLLAITRQQHAEQIAEKDRKIRDLEDTSTAQTVRQLSRELLTVNEERRQAESREAALKEQIAEKDREIAFKDSLIWTSRESELYKATVVAEKAQKAAESRETALRAELETERIISASRITTRQIDVNVIEAYQKQVESLQQQVETLKQEQGK